MSNSKFSRRGVLKTGMVASAGLALPTYLRADAHAGFTNAPGDSEVVLGFNVPQTGPYADEGADELRVLLVARVVEVEQLADFLKTEPETLAAQDQFEARAVAAGGGRDLEVTSEVLGLEDVFRELTRPEARTAEAAETDGQNRALELRNQFGERLAVDDVALLDPLTGLHQRLLDRRRPGADRLAARGGLIRGAACRKPPRRARSGRRRLGPTRRSGWCGRAAPRPRGALGSRAGGRDRTSRADRT